MQSMHKKGLTYQERAEKRLRRLVCDQYNRGYSAESIARSLSIPLVKVEQYINSMLDVHYNLLKAHQKKIESGVPLMHPWLDPWDEANVHGYWVPTPEEIQRSMLAERQSRNPNYE